MYLLKEVSAVLGYVSPDNNVLNESQEYFECVMRRLQLGNPSNYQQVLQLFRGCTERYRIE